MILYTVLCGDYSHGLAEIQERGVDSTKRPYGELSRMTHWVNVGATDWPSSANTEIAVTAYSRTHHSRALPELPSLKLRPFQSPAVCVGGIVR